MKAPLVIERLGIFLAPGSMVGLVGRSGAGKTTLANSLLAQMRTHRIGMVFQEPLLALNPTMRIERQIIEALRANGIARGAAARAKATEALVAVGLDARHGRQYPHELSGGMRQRALIAMAFAIEPDVIIADEPTTALDPALQTQILDLLTSRCRTSGTALLLISHDLPLVARYCERVLVLENAQVVEDGPAAEVLASRLAPPPSPLPHAPLLSLIAPADSPAMVDVGHLSVQFGDMRVVDDVHLTIPRGACLGIVGESGAGKTTLARCIAGLQTPTSGDVRFDGTYLSALDERARRRLRRRIQLIPQDAGASLTPHRTVLDLVQEGIDVHALASGADATRRAREAIAAVGLDAALAERKARALSTGERQRAAIARALAVEPELLLCDEPTANVDAEVRERILALLDRLRVERGLTLVLISHDHGAIRRMASGVIVMQHGRVLPPA